MAKQVRHVVIVMNPGPRELKPVSKITDRAKRYRANHPDNLPPLPRQCGFCGSKKNVIPHHVNGNEDHSNPVNLMWACKSCNGKVGHVLRKANLGKLTRQFNPAKKRGRASSQSEMMRAYNFAILVMRGKEDGDVKKAMETIHATPRSMRSAYTKKQWGTRRERYGPSGRQSKLFDEVPF